MPPRRWFSHSEILSKCVFLFVCHSCVAAAPAVNANTDTPLTLLISMYARTILANQMFHQIKISTGLIYVSNVIRNVPTALCII